jgi:adenylate cyclase
MTPQELVNHLNAYLTAITDVLMDYQGTLDKYIGDAIMGFWGAPLPQPDHALLACKCALKQMEVLGQLNEVWPPEKRLDIGIGLNSGIMTVGNMGSLGRLSYTLTGDNVNLGARLEGTNKTYATKIIMSEFTHAMVKNKPVVIYELIDVIDGLIPPKPLVLKSMER